MRYQQAQLLLPSQQLLAEPVTHISVGPTNLGLPVFEACVKIQSQWGTSPSSNRSHLLIGFFLKVQDVIQSSIQGPPKEPDFKGHTHTCMSVDVGVLPKEFCLYKKKEQQQIAKLAGTLKCTPGAHFKSAKRSVLPLGTVNETWRSVLTRLPFEWHFRGCMRHSPFVFPLSLPSRLRLSHT